MGPLLFVIFINDMPYLVTRLLKLFADDSKLIASIKCEDDTSVKMIIDLLQKDIDALVNWANDWRMLFNMCKCKSMIITKSGRSTNNPKFYM